MFSSICEGYVTVIFMYTISTVHNPDRQNHVSVDLKDYDILNYQV